MKNYPLTPNQRSGKLHDKYYDPEYELGWYYRNRFYFSRLYEEAVIAFDSLILRGVKYERLLKIRQFYRNRDGSDIPFWNYLITTMRWARRENKRWPGDPIVELQKYYEPQDFASLVLDHTLRDTMPEIRRRLMEINRAYKKEERRKDLEYRKTHPVNYRPQAQFPGRICL